MILHAFLPMFVVRRVLVLGFALLGFLAGCGDRTRIDADWHRRDLVDGLLARWVAVAPTDSGFMRTAVDRQWKPRPQQPGYLTEQARLVYSLIIGYEITHEEIYLDAAARGADFMLSNYHDPVHGGFFQRVAPDGKVISEAKNLYAHAFALLALSHMFRVTRDERYRAAALQTWHDIDTGMRDPTGGYRGELPRNFSQAGRFDGYTQNPMMHLFEALLALHDATQDPVALKGAKKLADFVVYHLLVGTSDGGAYIPEWYGPDWKPLPTREKGGYVDLGHQFEWSHMLAAAGKRGLSDIYPLTGERILKFAVKVGYDEIDGGVFTKMFPDGTVDREKYWWQQTEGMRAFLAIAATAGQQDMWRRYEQTLGLLQAQFIDRKNGGWYPKTYAQCQRGGCTDEQPEPYHMTGLHQAALNAAKQ